MLQQTSSSLFFYQETIQALGGLPVLFPLLEQACFKVTRERTGTRLSNQLDYTDEAPRSKCENSDCENGTGNSKEKVNLTENNSNQNLILQTGGISNTDGESLVDLKKSDDMSNRASSNENNKLDATDGKSKVLSDLSISYSPKKYLPKAVGDWVESINEESNSIEVLDKTETDKTGKDQIDSTTRKASVNTFVRSASNVSVPEERGKYVFLVGCYTAQKMKFSIRISSVNVTKFPGNCGFGHIY